MLIKHLRIYSSNLHLQKDFYSNILGLEIIASGKLEVSFRIGNSVLTIEERPDSTPYHFAINIPSNQEEEALVWLKQRVEVLRDGDNEIQEFDFWNVKAL